MSDELYSCLVECSQTEFESYSAGDVDQMLGLPDDYLSLVDSVSLEGRVGPWSIMGCVRHSRSSRAAHP